MTTFNDARIATQRKKILAALPVNEIATIIRRYGIHVPRHPNNAELMRQAVVNNWSLAITTDVCRVVERLLNTGF